MDDRLNAVLDIISKVGKRDRASLSGETTMSSLDLDSLAFVEVVLEMEERLGLTIPDDELVLEDFRTISDFQASARAKVAQ